MTTATRIEWRLFAADFWREPSGRFDLWYSPATGKWVAVDADAGRVRRFGTAEAAKAWCEARAEGKA